MTKKDTYQPTGIFHLTGDPDTGKTTAAISAYHPQKTAYFFDDVKRPPITDFGLFVDLVDKYSNLKLLEFYQAIKGEIEKIPDKKYDAIIFDTWARMGKAIRYYAKANPYEFREQSTFAPSGTIANMEKWGEAHLVEAAFISQLSRKAKALFLITHTKEKIIGGARSGLMEPDCGRSFNRICNLRLWLRHNEHSGVPIALVLKRLSRATVNENGVEVLNVLPRRIKPLQAELSIWQAIDRYWQQPFGNREPEPAEKPTDFELSILDGVLTQDQREVWRAELEAKKQQDKEEDDFLQQQYETVKARVKELADSLTGPLPIVVADILPQIIKEFGNGHNQDSVAEMLK